MTTQGVNDANNKYLNFRWVPKIVFKALLSLSMIELNIRIYLCLLIVSYNDWGHWKLIGLLVVPTPSFWEFFFSPKSQRVCCS